MSQIIDLFSYCQYFRRSLKKLFPNKQQALYWHDSDWPTKSIWYDKPQNPTWQTSSNRLFKESNQLVWIIFSRTSLYCRSSKSGFKLLKNFMWCSARFNFRSFTVFDMIWAKLWNDMTQAVECDLYLYADDLCLLFQHKNVTEIKNS